MTLDTFESRMEQLAQKYGMRFKCRCSHGEFCQKCLVTPDDHAGAYMAGAAAARAEFVEYLKKYREAYHEDLFGGDDLSQFDPKIVTAVSGRMGRHILDNCIRDWS